MAPKLSHAIEAVNKTGMLLVFSIKNKPTIPSLWSYFYPRSKMKWEWTDDGDNRVADLWHLREQISSSGKVIYAKWYQGRATMISKELFPALLRVLNPDPHFLNSLSNTSLNLYKKLEDNSPLSTKSLKELSGLKGKEFESEYTRTLSELWKKLLIVGYGEIDDGAFPSLAMGTAKNYFEEEWKTSKKLSVNKASEEIKRILTEESPFYKYLIKLTKLKTAEKSFPKLPQKKWLSMEDLV